LHFQWVKPRFTLTAVAWKNPRGARTKSTTLSDHVFPSQAAQSASRNRVLAPWADAWANDRFETLLFCGLLAGLAWAPLWLGGDRPLPWGVNGLWFPALAGVYELSLVLRDRKHPFALKQIAAPAGLFGLAVIWIVVQTSSLTPTLAAHPIWAMASDALGVSLSGSISVNPGASALALMRLLTDASVFWLALQLCRAPARALLLLQGLLAIIAAYSAVGLFLSAFFGGAIPFFDDGEAGRFVRSTFVNRNNFATYAGLGLIIALGLTLRLYRHEVPDQAGLRSYRLNKLIGTTGRRGWLLVVAGLTILAALLGTVSRGGVLASGVGLLTLLILSFSLKNRRASEQIETIVFVTLALVAGFLFFGDRVVGRISTAGLGDSNRMAVYLITFHSILDAPILGFGYGAFADVFPMYRDQSISAVGVWDMAHNTYLEVAQGLGLIFGSCLIAALAGLALQCLKGAIRRHRDATIATIATCACLLVGLQAMVDFSIQIEAVALTFMAILGAGVAQSVSSRIVSSD
jgi:O-antigen ligase